MLLMAILFFTIAGLLGIYLLSFIVQNKNTPKAIVFTHGPLAAIGLTLLLIYIIFYSPKPFISFILFVLAALGGITLIYRDLTNQTIPKWLAIGHGTIAIIAFLLLLLFAAS